MTTKAAVRPVMIMTCCTVVIRPRMFAGATSEMYAGESTLAAPTAMPPANRAMTKMHVQIGQALDQRADQEQHGGEHHDVPAADHVGEAPGEEGADDAADQQRTDGEAEPGVAETESRRSGPPGCR